MKRLLLIDETDRLIDIFGPLSAKGEGDCRNMSDEDDVIDLGHDIAVMVNRGHSMRRPIEKAIRFVELGEILPRDWSDWFYDWITTYSFGDTDRTLVRASAFRKAADNIRSAFLDDPDLPIELCDTIRNQSAHFDALLASLGETYIDLEN